MNVFIITNEDAEILGVIEPNVNALRQFFIDYYANIDYDSADLDYIDVREFTMNGSFPVYAHRSDEWVDTRYVDTFWIDNFPVMGSNVPFEDLCY